MIPGFQETAESKARARQRTVDVRRVGSFLVSWSFEPEGAVAKAKGYVAHDYRRHYDLRLEQRWLVTDRTTGELLAEFTTKEALK